MIVLYIFDKEIYLDLEVRNYYSIVIENKKKLLELEKYIYFDFSGKEEFIKCKIDNNFINPDKIATLIYPIFNPDFNNKRNINSLYKILKNFYREDVDSSVETINSKIKEIIDTISLDYSINIETTEEIKIEDIFKISNLRFAENYNSLLERIIQFCVVTKEIRNVFIFFVFDLNKYFEQEEIQLLLKDLYIKGIFLINIENSVKENEETKHISLLIDSDLCVIN